MKKLIIFLQLILSTFIFSQEISLNQKFIESYLRFNQLIDSSKSIYSFNIRPIINDDQNNYTILKSFKKNILNKSWLKVDLYPIEYIFEYNSHHPYNRNNGTMIPNKGYQHILSGGFKLKSGPLVIKIRPEHIKICNENGALAVKLLGAGGGGFIFVLIKKNNINLIKKKIKKFEFVSCKYEPNGSSIILEEKK